MLGTWQPTSRDSSPTERSPVASVSRTHSRLGSDNARATFAVRWRSSSVAGSVALIIRFVFSHLLRKDASVRGSVEVQFVQAVVVESGMVRELVQHRAADLVLELARLGEVLLEREPEERDPVRDGGPVGAIGGGWDALVQPVERLVLVHALVAELLQRRLVVDHD